MRPPSETDTVAQDLVAPTIAAPPSDPGVDLERGTLRLEGGVRYVRRTTLGQGGMGVVELGTDHLIGRDVAIKTLRPQLMEDPRVVERFLREARVQGQLEHPAIVPVYDIGRTEEGALYFAMKRVKGRTLREVLDGLRTEPEADARFGRRRLLSVFAQVCQAIAFAHSRGVVHRDLKPDNLMLGEHGEVYVLDWGVARLRKGDDDLVLAEHHAGDGGTRQGVIIGTVGYMSPEQASGDHERVDERSDVWSLGAILFELLSLEPLIERASVPEMLAATVLGGDGDPTRVDPELPPELAALCVSATATDREQRLASARALADAIERYLDGDRDARMRRDRSEEHARAALAAASRAFESDDLELRRAAMQETGAALALDPSNADARKTLLELLTRPPRRMPEAARARFTADRAQTLRSFYRESLVSMGVYVPLLLLLLLLGLREPWAVYATVVPGLGFIALCAHGLRHPRPDSYRPLLQFVLLNVGMMFFARFITPLLVLPLLAAMNTMISVGYRGRAPGWTFAVAGVLPVLGSGMLELLGVWAPTMAYAGGVLQLHSGALELGDSSLVLPFLLLSSSLPVLLGSTLLGRVQRSGEDIARAAHVQRWQLEQLVMGGRPPVAAHGQVLQP